MVKKRRLILLTILFSNMLFLVIGKSEGVFSDMGILPENKFSVGNWEASPSPTPTATPSPVTSPVTE